MKVMSRRAPWWKVYQLKRAQGPLEQLVRAQGLSLLLWQMMKVKSIYLGNLHLQHYTFFLQGFLDEVENGGAQLDLLQEQVEVQGSEEFVPDITFTYRENESEVNNSQSETSGGPLLFLEISTENDEDNSSEK